VGADTTMNMRSLERTGEIESKLVQEDVRHEEPERGDGKDPCSTVALAKMNPPASGKGGEEAHGGGHDGLQSGGACLDCGVCATSRGRDAERVCCRCGVIWEEY